MESSVIAILGAVGGGLILLFGLIAVVLVRVRKRSRLERRIAMVSGGDPTSKGAEKKKKAQAKLLADGKLDEMESQAKKKKADRESLRQRLEAAGVDMTPRAYTLTWAAIGLVTFAVMPMFGIGMLGSVLAGITVGLGLPRKVLSSKKKRRMTRFMDAFPDAVDIIVRGIKSGLPLGECINIIAAESPEPIRGEFRSILEGMRIGLTLEESLQRAVDRMPVPEFRFFGIVLSISAQTGGNLGETLENLSLILRARRQMKHKVKAMSSEARSTAMIIGCMPIVMGIMLFFTSREYIAVLFSTPGGKLTVGIGILSMFTGTAIMNKMINFKI